MTASDASAATSAEPTLALTASSRMHSAGASRAAALDGRELAYRTSPGPGLAIVAPLSFGVTLAGVDAAHGQREFLDAMASGSFLVTFDQRGAGASASAGAPVSWEQRAADLWSVADAAGVERAVLYGVADAGHTTIQAAIASPDRVLGLILNFVPLSFAAASAGEGVPGNRAQGWANGGGPSRSMMQDFGVAESDAAELVEAWNASTNPAVVARMQRLLADADIRSLLPQITQPTLVIEPARQPLFHGWGGSLAELLPNARVARPARSIQTLGTIHGFLSLLGLDLGRHASQLTPAVSRAVVSGERALSELRRIAVAVDDDMISARAVELACRLGEAQRAEIALIHVVNVPYTLTLDEPPRDRVRAGERALSLGAAIVERHGLPPARRRLVTGRSIAGSILAAADELHADLIVLANDGKPGPSSSGSEVVAELLRRAPGKVLIDRAGS